MVTVKASTGTGDRKLDRMAAVRPEAVRQMMAAAPFSSAIRQAERQMDSSKVTTFRRWRSRAT